MYRHSIFIQEKRIPDDYRVIGEYVWCSSALIARVGGTGYPTALAFVAAKIWH